MAPPCPSAGVQRPVLVRLHEQQEHQPDPEDVVPLVAHQRRAFEDRHFADEHEEAREPGVPAGDPEQGHDDDRQVVEQERRAAEMGHDLGRPVVRPDGLRGLGPLRSRAEQDVAVPDVADEEAQHGAAGQDAGRCGAVQRVFVLDEPPKHHSLPGLEVGTA